MAVDFPDSPTIGQTFTFGKLVYEWDGSKWIVTTDSYDPDLIPENIREGIKIFNVTGTLIEKPPLEYFLEFDGIDDYVNTNFGINSLIGNITEFEMDVLINETSYSDFPFIIGGIGTNFGRLYLYLSNNGNISIGLGDNLAIIDKSYNFNVNTVYNFRFIINDNNNTFELYIDDQLELSGSYSTQSRPSNTDLQIMALNNTQQLKGQLNYFSITQNSTKILEYLVDEGTGTTLTDSVGNNDGTIIGATWEQKGIDVSAANAIESDVLSPKTFYAGSSSSIKTGTIPSKGAETFTPGTTNQTIASGQYLSGTQTVLGDADLIAENIKEGVTLFGVTGTLIPKPEFSPIQASGGFVSDVTIDNIEYRIHAFTNTGVNQFSVFDVPSSNIIDVLIVGGGGGGAASGGGGGGAGGVVYKSVPVFAQNYTIVVGTGGSAATSTDNNSFPEKGGNSSAFNIIALGGGAGDAVSTNDINLVNGGSGGGASRFDSYSQSGLGLQPTTEDGGFGNDGGENLANNSSSAGGGGAGAPGEDATQSCCAGDGGDGLYYGNIFTDNYGDNGWFAGGGGGAGWVGNWGGTIGIGGIGGGGNGRTSIADTSNMNALPNTGGGGGAGLYDGGFYGGGNGGSGIVLIRYPLEDISE